LTINNPEHEDGGVVLPKWISQALPLALVAIMGWWFGQNRDATKNDATLQTSFEIRMTASEKDRAELHAEMQQLATSVQQLAQSQARYEGDASALREGQARMERMIQEHMDQEQRDHHAGK
jgi:uncharacterized membrane protein